MLPCAGPRWCGGDDEAHGDRFRPSHQLLASTRQKLVIQPLIEGLNELRIRQETLEHKFENIVNQSGLNFAMKFDSLAQHVREQEALVQRLISNMGVKSDKPLQHDVSYEKIKEMMEDMQRSQASALQIQTSELKEQLWKLETHFKSHGNQSEAESKIAIPEEYDQTKDMMKELQRQQAGILQKHADVEATTKELKEQLQAFRQPRDSQGTQLDAITIDVVEKPSALHENSPKFAFQDFESLRHTVLEDIRREVTACVSAMPGKCNGLEDEIHHDKNRIENTAAIVVPLTDIVTEVDFHESIWDASVLLCLGLPVVSNVVLVITLFANVFGQTVFCLVIGAQFSESDLPPNDRMKYWRAAAHEYSNADTITDTSLVARVCSQDASLQVASSQVDIVQDAQDYLSPIGVSGLRTGPVIFALSWMLWAMVAFNHGSAALRLFIGLCHLPRGKHTHLAHTSAELSLEYISLRRLAFMALLTLARLTVCVSIGWFGTLWLANTVNMGNLVLNASALGFVLDMDNMLFGVFIPPVIKGALKVLKPVSLPLCGKHCGVRSFVFHFGTRPLLAVVILGLLLMYTWFTQVWPIVQQLETLSDTLCGGDRNFVWRYKADLAIMMARKTPVYKAFTNDYTDSQQHKLNAAEQLWLRNLGGVNDYTSIVNRKAWLVNNINVYELMTQMPIEKLTYNIGIGNVACNSSHDVFSTLPVFVVKGIQGVSGVPNATSCNEIVHACGFWNASVLRVYCPSQCGCSDPRSGLYYSGPAAGCPREKCFLGPLNNTASDEFICEDPTAAELANMSGWIRYWDQFASPDAMGFLYNQSGYTASEMAENAKLLGCSFLGQSFLIGSFCYETSFTGSIAAFCPVTCGCRRYPSFPGCPSSCA